MRKSYFKLAKELNVDGVELVLGYKTYFSFEMLKKLFFEYKIPILSIHQPIAFILKSKYDELPFKVAQYFKAKYIAHPLSDVSLCDKKAKNHFSWLKDMQNKYKVEILIENMPKTWGIRFLRYLVRLDKSLSDLVKLNEVCKKYEFGFTLDTTHLAQKEPMKTDGYSLIQPYMQNIHLSDFKGEKTHLPLGLGDLNLKAFIQGLQKEKYEGLLTLEIFRDMDLGWINGKNQLFQDIRTSIKLIRKYCNL